LIDISKGISKYDFKASNLRNQSFLSFYFDYKVLKKELLILLNSTYPKIDSKIIKEYSEVFFDRLIILKFLEVQKLFELRGYGQKFLENSFKPFSEDENNNYYLSVFNHLILAFNTPIQDRLRHNKYKKLPYINIGLFRETRLEKYLNRNIEIPNSLLSKVFYSSNRKKAFFQKYHWTFEDSIEEGINPDIISSIIEQDTYQKSYGTFYTNRNVSKYLAQQSLLAYLHQNLEKRFKSLEELKYWIYNGTHNKNGETEQEILVLLKKCKILDPAVGSGSLLIGILKEIIEILQVLQILDKKNKKDLYNNLIDFFINIYGVDIQEKEIDKCKIRFFLFLVQYIPMNQDTLFFPNLEFRLLKGNSLIGYADTSEKELDGFNRRIISSNVIKNIRRLDKDYFFASNFERVSKLTIEIQDIKKSMLFLLNNIYFDNHLIRLQRKLIEEILKVLKKIWESNDVLVDEKILYYLQKTSRWSVISKQIIENGDDQILLECFNIYGWEAFFNKLKSFHWILQIFPLLNHEKFDIVIANPPYLAYESMKEIPINKVNSYLMKKYLQVIVEETVFFNWQNMRWDLQLPFIERCTKLVSDKGIISLLIADSFCRNEWGKYGRKDLLNRFSLLKLVHFHPNVKLFKKIGSTKIQDVGVQNFILIFTPNFKNNNIPSRLTFNDSSFLDPNIIHPPDLKQSQMDDHSAFRFDQEEFKISGIPLRFIAYISYGMILSANTDISNYKGKFGKNDLIISSKTKYHPYSYLENKFLAPFCVITKRYLEWGTERVPKMIERPRFQELYEGKVLFAPKIIGSEKRIKVYVSSSGYRTNDSIIVFKLWNSFENLTAKGNNNGMKSLIKELNRIKKDFHDFKNVDFNFLNLISNKFTIEAISATISSKTTNKFIRSQMKHKNQFYPNSWKNIPIPLYTKEEVDKLTKLVKNAQMRRKPPLNWKNETKNPNINSNIDDLLIEIDSIVEKAYNREVDVKQLMKSIL
jgi:hypothetical protein